MPQVSEIMSSDVLSLTTTARVIDALRMMSGANVRHIPVLDDEGKMAGLLSDRDMHQFGDSDEISADVVMRYLHSPVSKVMTTDPEVVGPTATLDEAADRLIGSKISALPVVDGGKLVGVLSVVDLLVWMRKQGTLGG